MPARAPWGWGVAPVGARGSAPDGVLFVSTDFGCRGVDVDETGRFWIVGGIFNGTGEDLALARLLPSGQLDLAFETNGSTIFQ